MPEQETLLLYYYYYWQIWLMNTHTKRLYAHVQWTLYRRQHINQTTKKDVLQYTNLFCIEPNFCYPQHLIYLQPNGFLGEKIIYNIYIYITLYFIYSLKTVNKDIPNERHRLSKLFENSTRTIFLWMWICFYSACIVEKYIRIIKIVKWN